jgi:hypothetical protein
MSMVDFVGVFSNLSLIEAYETMEPLVTFVIGMGIYAFFIFFFYRMLSKRDLFSLKKSAYQETSAGAAVAYVLKYIFLFPFFVFFWFAVLFVLLLLLSRSHDVYTTMLIAMAVVGAVRITAYYKEALSQDLAKMLPFALLGIFLVDISYFSFQDALNAAITAFNTDNFWRVLIYYLLFTIAMEFTLRVGHGIAARVRQSRGEKVYPTVVKEEPEERETPVETVKVEEEAPGEMTKRRRR